VTAACVFGRTVCIGILDLQAMAEEYDVFFSYRRDPLIQGSRLATVVRKG
jgi:hypothetical protein